MNWAWALRWIKFGARRICRCGWRWPRPDSFGLVILITLLRAEKSVANGALAVITLLAIGVASAATLRGFGPDGRVAPAESRPVQQVAAVLPQLSCIDDLAGDAVLDACEKILFGSAESDRRRGCLCRLPDHAADRVRRRGFCRTSIRIPNCLHYGARSSATATG